MVLVVGTAFEELDWDLLAILRFSNVRGRVTNALLAQGMRRWNPIHRRCSNWKTTFGPQATDGVPVGSLGLWQRQTKDGV